MTPRNGQFFHLLTLLTMVGLMACTKEDTAPPTAPPPPAQPTTTLRIEHHIDEVLLQFDTLLYTTATGHAYSVSRLEYYLSGIRLTTADCCDEEPVITGPFYINASADLPFDLGVLPAGDYTGAELHLGLTPELNITGTLPNTLENVNMAWPDPMGGGYHFMKFEGHFLNGGTPAGYAIHLGRNENLPTCTVPGTFQLDGNAHTLVLRFNLNEVFRTPHAYDLPTGSYSMGSAELMGLLRDNCADAFTVTLQP